MASGTLRAGVWGGSLCLLLTLSGCGGGGSAPSNGEGTGDAQPPGQGAPPTVAIGDEGAKSDATGDVPAEPEPGTPLWLAREIRLVRMQALPEKVDVQGIAAIQKERNRKIVDLASQSISATHDKPELAELFDDAIHQLMEARLQLALSGDEENRAALYEDAASLFQRDPKSAAAAESSFVVAQFSHTQALKYARQEPKWLDEFSRQARQFAANFPQQDGRAVSLLLAAAWSCELHRRTDEAIACYSLLAEKFPDSPQGQQARGVLRRLTLPGKPLVLAGPTIDGGFVTAEEFRGKPLLVVFWSSTAQPFVDKVAAFQEATKKYEPQGLKVVGVCLDEDESAVDAFLEQHPLSWPQIWFSKPDEKGWNNRLVKFFGVREVPAVWLVDAQGVVRDVYVDPAKLDERLAPLFRTGE